jgi:2-polyprenyl-6-methoxyphenol hydroxylase-like FAD-dependent oxidoreductase
VPTREAVGLFQKLRHDADEVTLSVVTEREAEELRAVWVIGADGAGSGRPLRM